MEKQQNVLNRRVQELLAEKKESGPSREATNTGTVPNVSGSN